MVQPVNEPFFHIRMRDVIITFIVCPNVFLARYVLCKPAGTVVAMPDIKVFLADSIIFSS